MSSCEGSGPFPPVSMGSRSAVGGVPRPGPGQPPSLPDDLSSPWLCSCLRAGLGDAAQVRRSPGPCDVACGWRAGLRRGTGRLVAVLLATWGLSASVGTRVHLTRAVAMVRCWVSRYFLGSRFLVPCRQGLAHAGSGPHTGRCWERVCGVCHPRRDGAASAQLQLCAHSGCPETHRPCLSKAVCGRCATSPCPHSARDSSPWGVRSPAGRHLPVSCLSQAWVRQGVLSAPESPPGLADGALPLVAPLPTAPQRHQLEKAAETRPCWAGLGGWPVKGAARCGRSPPPRVLVGRVSWLPVRQGGRKPPTLLVLLRAAPPCWGTTAAPPQTGLCSASPPKLGSAAKWCFRQSAKCSGEGGWGRLSVLSLVLPLGQSGQGWLQLVSALACGPLCWAGVANGGQRRPAGVSSFVSVAGSPLSVSPLLPEGDGAHRHSCLTPPPAPSGRALHHRQTGCLACCPQARRPEPVHEWPCPEN